MPHYFDISPLISPELAVFPGDTPFERLIAMDFDRGDHLGLSSIRGTVHLGAHTDAPNHYDPNGVGMDGVDPTLYLGRCQVFRVACASGARICAKDFALDRVNCARVLFATGSFPDPNQWNDDFNSLEPNLIQALYDKGVRLVGIDTPSIDPATSKALESHQKVKDLGMGILEGVVLQDVSPGAYILSALPLKIKDADASPVRALLFPADSDWRTW
ncbi:cyclase family protein [Acanthopleuribacter pedis]|uniref:Kynurenine formamidase n=1 Tax=Acanthopleuribacter pedis TaxID=442870 RepID=A0A8J7QQH3_9BACT|nr:cyclase family protein [Acanthopleuribacter pedis]MBO1322300.1 cyclase family protein [Acanthopleuribacter pedis]